MKCPKCDGVGFVPTNVFGINGAIKCDFCDGTGVFITNAVEPMTNEEWRKTCSAEEFAEWMAQYCCDVNTSDVKEILKNEWLDWLKQPHTPQPPQKQDDYPCNVKGCSLETRQSCCGCPDYFKWKEHHESR